MITSPNATELCAKGFCTGTYNPMPLIGVILIILGAVGLMWLGLRLWTEEDVKE